MPREVNAEKLWETTLDRSKRVLLSSTPASRHPDSFRRFAPLEQRHGGAPHHDDSHHPKRSCMNPADGMGQESVISLDNIQTITKRQLLTRLVRISDQKLEQIFAAVRHAFDMP